MTTFDPMAYAETFSGRRVHLLLPDPATIFLPDIAHSLAMQCRYNGHCRAFYSVAEHSVHVSTYLESVNKSPATCLIGMLHDAAEAYVGDCISPVKRLVPAFKDIEKGILAAIFEAVNIDVSDEDWADARWADVQLLADEANVLMPSGGQDWNLPVGPRSPEWFPVPRWSPEWAAMRFHERFEDLAEQVRIQLVGWCPQPTLGIVQ